MRRDGRVIGVVLGFLVAGLIAPALAYYLVSLVEYDLATHAPETLVPIETAGPLTGLLAGLLIGGAGRGWALLVDRQPAAPAIAATSTLLGMVPAAAIVYVDQFGPTRVEWPPFWTGSLPLGPFWIGGAALAYGVAAMLQGRRPQMLAAGGWIEAGVAAGIAAGFGWTALFAAHRFGWMTWNVSYAPPSGVVGWDGDLVRSAWYPAIAVVLACLIVRRWSGRGSSVWLPLGAGAGAAAVTVPYLYVHVPPGNLGNPSSAAAIGVLTGSAAAVVALRHPGARAGMIAYIAWVSAIEALPVLNVGGNPGSVTWQLGLGLHDMSVADLVWELIRHGMDARAFDLTSGLIGPVVVAGAVAAWVAIRHGFASGVVAAIGGPLLLMLAYLTIDPQLNYQEATHTEEWASAFAAVPISLAVGIVASGIGALLIRRRAAEPGPAEDH